MEKLIKAEFLKLSKLRGYKILLLCSVAIGVVVGIVMLSMPSEMMEEIGSLNGYRVYLSSLTDTQLFMTSSIIFAAIFVCNEFTNRTFGMSLFSGCPRFGILLSKAIVFLIGLLPIIFTEPLLAGIIVSISKGFGTLDASMWVELVQTTMLFILGGASIGGFCFTLAVLVKNIGGTIGAGLGLMVGMQLIGMFPGTANLVKLTFLYQMGTVSQPESIGLFIAVTAITLLGTLGISTFAFQKSELK